MEEVILKRIKEMSSKNIDFIHYFKLDKGFDIVTYKNIEQLYLEFVYKYYLNGSISEIIDILENSHVQQNVLSNNNLGAFSLSIAINENELSNFLEEIFTENISSSTDDLIIFYKKGEEKLLILFKSFYPLIDVDKISLPHFCLYLTNKESINNLNKMFEEDENLICINCSY